MPPVSSHEIAPVQPGDVLDGKYRVDRVLGVGGMGIVVLATHTQLDQKVALKFLLPSALGNPQIIQRFAREARAAAQIQSEHVARVMDVGTLPTGSPYMVMEFLDGHDLAEALEKGGPLPVPKAVGCVLQACEAIAEAHALGIVHRDLKPANLFLARRASGDPIVKVLDFGISKTNEAGPSSLTHTSAVMGSPYYMAPEQMMSSKDVDARSDIWALGIILYELLTGSPPFVADTMPEIVFMVTQRDPPPLLTKRPDVPPELADVIARCLRREMAGRFPDVAKLAFALAPFGPPRSEISLERISRVLGASMPPSGTETPTALRRQATASTWVNSQVGRRPESKTTLIAVATALALAIGGFIVWRTTRPRNVAAPVAAASSATPNTLPSASVATPTVAASPVPTTETPPPAAAPSAIAPENSASAPTVAPAANAKPIARFQPRPRAKPAVAPVPQAPAEPRAPASKGLNMGMKE